MHDFSSNDPVPEDKPEPINDRVDHHVDKEEAPSKTILSHVTKHTPSLLTPGDIRKVMSTSMKSNKTYSANTVYTFSEHNVKETRDIKALVDRGANGTIAGCDTTLIECTGKLVNCKGLDGYEMEMIAVGTVGAVTETQHGKIIVIIHQAA